MAAQGALCELASRQVRKELQRPFERLGDEVMTVVKVWCRSL